MNLQISQGELYMGVSPIPKGVYHKILIFSSNTKFFFSEKGGRGLAQSKISLAEKIWASKLIGGGGLARSEKLKKTVFLCLP